MAYFWSLIVFFGIMLMGIGLDFSTFSLQLYAIVWFIDIPSLLIVVVSTLGFSLTHTPIKDLKFGLLFDREQQNNLTEVKRLRHFLHNTGNLSLFAGVIGAFMGLIIVLNNLNEPSKIGPAMAITLISLCYGLGFKTLVYSAEMRLKHPSESWDELLKNQDIEWAPYFYTALGTLSYFALMMALLANQ